VATTWHHPEFGEFTFDGYRWTATVDLPAFQRFGYTPSYGDQSPPSGTCELSVEVDDDGDGGSEPNPPSDEALALVSKVLAEQAHLAPKVVAALWDDFNGRGPRSGMWWHGGLDDVVEDVDPALSPLDGPDALYFWLRLSGIGVRWVRRGSEDRRPVVELSFDAPFEEEHGVGVLTDGSAILGTGYSGDASPFRAD
jgi:hypothetical protein